MLALFVLIPLCFGLLGACAHHEVAEAMPVASATQGAHTGPLEPAAPVAPSAAPPPVQSAAPSAPAANAPKYVCPMHPEITAAAAGSCPRCGMALVAPE